MKDHIKNIIIVVLAAGLAFFAGFAIGSFNMINWIVDTVIKMINSDNGASLLFDLMKAWSKGNLSQIAIHP